MYDMKTLNWQKVVTREYSYLWASYTAEAYKIMKKITGTTLKHNLFYTEDKLLTIYRDPKDIENSFKLIKNLIQKNPRKTLENMDKFETLTNDGYDLFKEINAVQTTEKKKIRNLLLLLDRLFIKIVSYYLFVVFLGYAADESVIKKFLSANKKQFERIRMGTIDVDMNKEFPKLFAKYDKKLGVHTSYMSRGELINFVKGKKVDWKKIITRHKKALLIVKNNVNTECPEKLIAKTLNRELGHSQYNPETKTIKGTIVQKGLVKGRVVRIMTESEYKNIKKGDILVTPMTKPNILPYLKRVKGIITNDGGALSHASIISREMKIPCIVGTMYATDILINNEKVVLDANQGLVIRLDKKNPIQAQPLPKTQK